MYVYVYIDMFCVYTRMYFQLYVYAGIHKYIHVGIPKIFKVCQLYPPYRKPGPGQTYNCST